MSLSSSVVACAAALARRAKPVIMICPFVRFYTDEERAKVVKEMTDHTSQIKNNPAFSMVPFDSRRENPVGMIAESGLQAYEFMTNVKEHAPNFEDRATIQSY
ncbi:hypothetical protein FQN54_006167 [Arachnomyces sp. PD_36]|nr:hypothetical protein FQN54_006167 [Arachnomyces sp. PD_36]